MAPPRTIRALSLYPIWAHLVAAGQKDLEIRSRVTRYRGPLLICSTKRPRYDDLPAGVAVCVVNLIDCRPMVPADESRAGAAFAPGLFVWELAAVQPVQHFPVHGQLGIFTVELPENVLIP